MKTSNNNLQIGLKISHICKWIKFTKYGIFTSSLTVVCKSEQKPAQINDYIWYKKMTQKWVKNKMLEWHQFNYQKHNSFKLDIKCPSMHGIGNFKDLWCDWPLKNFKALWRDCMHEPWNFNDLRCDCISLEISKPFGVAACALKFQSPLAWLHEPWNFNDLRCDCMSLEISKTISVTDHWHPRLWCNWYNFIGDFEDLWCIAMSVQSDIGNLTCLVDATALGLRVSKRIG